MYLRHKRYSLVYAIVLLMFFVGCGGSSKEEPTEESTVLGNIAGDGQLDIKLEAIRAKYQVPALAGFIVDNQALIEISAMGKRSRDADQTVSKNDYWHIGSLTKSMTATLAGFLVDEGLIRWDSTIEEIFPEFQATTLSKYRQLELQQLLSMSSGLEDNFENPVYVPLDFDQPEAAQRAQGTRLALSYDHGLAIGQFHYANTNYVIAGAMLEKVTQEKWGDLLQQRVLTPLMINSVGFGAPGTEGLLDQPLGHTRGGDQYQGIYHDNRAVLSPAGRVHISLEDMAIYTIFQLQGVRGENTLLSENVFSELYRPRNSGNYALGWGVSNNILSHSGSNTLWYAAVHIDAERNFAAFAVVNAGDDRAMFAVRETLNTLVTRFARSIVTP